MIEIKPLRRQAVLAPWGRESRLFVTAALHGLLIEFYRINVEGG